MHRYYEGGTGKTQRGGITREGKERVIQREREGGGMIDPKYV